MDDMDWGRRKYGLKLDNFRKFAGFLESFQTMFDLLYLRPYNFCVSSLCLVSIRLSAWSGLGTERP
jgi:hypothetical protein